MKAQAMSLMANISNGSWHQWQRNVSVQQWLALKRHQRGWHRWRHRGANGVAYGAGGS